MMNLLDIGDVAAETGIAPSTLRHYEAVGLITPVARKGLRRQYAPEIRLQLAIIEMGQLAGFKLEEIASVFSKDGTPELPRSALREKVDDIDRQIRRLSVLRDLLQHVADCPAPSHLECSTFQRLIDIAGRKGRRRRTRQSPAK